MKRRTKSEKISDCFTAYKKILAGDKVKRDGAKDGSIPTHPVVPVDPKPEKLVVSDCLKWLHAHNIYCHRHDTGTFQNQFGQWGTYGIKNSGDIHGLLPNGIHLEIECKHGSGGRLSKGQQKRWNDIVDNNGIYLVCHGVEELEYFMRDLI